VTLANFTQLEIEQYYRVRLDSAGIHHIKGNEYRSRCILHGGDNPNSLWINAEIGNFKCFACDAKGPSIFAFEQEILRRSSLSSQAPNADAVLDSIHQVLGTPFIQRFCEEEISDKPKGTGWDRSRAQDYYRYTDELGEEICTVWRFEDRCGNKATPPDHPCICQRNPDAECEPGCENGRAWGAKGLRRVLYRLPDVIQSSLCFIVEGEKNVNDLSRALALYISKNHGFKLGKLILDRVAVTTNIGGASGWKPEYSYGRFFTGKIVVKLGDNDTAGRLHDEAVCADVSKYALQLFTLELPVGEGGDISDYLETWTIDDLIKLLESRKPYKVEQPKEGKIVEPLTPRIILVHPLDLGHKTGLGGDWLVEGLIERGQRGLVVAPPKVGKSLLFLDLAVALASGGKFLGINTCPGPVRTAIISREDGPDLVRRRLTQLAAGRGLTLHDINSFILVNTVKQSASFHIDVKKDLEEMAQWLKSGGVEFCVVDVLNKLHFAEENSSDGMTKVMEQFDVLASLSGSQVCVIHHLARAGNVKGSTSIESWADFICKLEQDSQDEAVKKVTIRTKSRGLVEPKTVRYWQSDDQLQSKILMVTKVMGG
jgi:KaiC/GvpD/RAD55 family RecA-like ATPase